MGFTQIVLWGGTYFLTAVVAGPIVRSTSWPPGLVVGALSIAILMSGVLSPWVGRMIQRYGGRPVLVSGALVIAAGQVLMACSTSLLLFLVAWIVMGLGMAAGLYDPLFAAIGQAYGTAARGAMTQIAIASGFAVTICWPVTGYLVDHFSWRFACVAYAGTAILVVVPIFLLVLPQRPPASWSLPSHGAACSTSSDPPNEGQLPGERLLACAFTASGVVTTAVSVQLLMLLEANGYTAAAAVTLSALIGPSQVGARILELFFGRGRHPIWAMLVSSAGVALSLLLLIVAPSQAWLAIILYGAGNGMRTVIRGTLPLALYGQHVYAAVMGRLARLPLLGQAATPLLCGYVSEWRGSNTLLALLLGVAAANVFLSLTMLRLMIYKREFGPP